MKKSLLVFSIGVVSGMAALIVVGQLGMRSIMSDIRSTEFGAKIKKLADEYKKKYPDKTH